MTARDRSPREGVDEASPVLSVHRPWPPALRFLPFRLPVRWRLTLWYTLLLAFVMALFGGALYFALQQQLYASFDEHLINQTALALASVRVEDGRPSMEPSAGGGDGEYFLRLFNRDERLLVDTGPDPGGIPLNMPVVRAALGGRTEFSNVLDEDQETLRIISVPVLGPGDEQNVVGVLQIGLDRNEIDEPLAGLLTALVLAGPLVLLVAACAGYLLAGRALAPVVTITDLAANIGAGDLHARLNLHLPDDELGRLARTFDAMLARIDDAFTRQRRFTGDAAHELRTPLTLMRGQVDLALARPRANEEYREALRGIDGDLARLTGLVGTLLALARADAGQLASERAPFDLANTVDLVIEQYAPLATEAEIALVKEASPATLIGDEDLMVQLLVNLIDNALAHTPPGGIITLGCSQPGKEIHLWVTDSGEGIASEHQERLFDRFYRVDAGRTRARGGTGLGLAICKAIAETHGGTIALTSERGRGTRVDIMLPGARPHL